MKKLLKYLKRLTTALSSKRLIKLALLFLTISLSLSITQTPSYATVKQTGTDEVTMSASDLRTLVGKYAEYRAAAEATQDALTAERKLHTEYAADVGALLSAQAAERTAWEQQVKALQKKLNAPSVELYGGYNTEHKWEGGMRLVFRLW